MDESKVIHVFILLLWLGQGDSKQLVSGDMYFYDVTECNWYAAELTKRYGNFKYRDYVPPELKATAYCEPRYVKKGSVTVY